MGSVNKMTNDLPADIPTEKIRLQLQFTTQGPIDDKQAVLRAYAVWTKCRKSLIDAFPSAHHTEFSQKLKLYGTQRYWLLTWLERFQQAKTMGESTEEVNNAWAALGLHYLDQIWPHLDKSEPHIIEQLDALHLMTNKIKGHKLVAAGIAAVCVRPDRMEGFIDIFDNATNNTKIFEWLERTFLARK